MVKSSRISCKIRQNPVLARSKNLDLVHPYLGCLKREVKYSNKPKQTFTLVAVAQADESQSLCLTYQMAFGRNMDLDDLVVKDLIRQA